jgi:hypothetical protein
MTAPHEPVRFTGGCFCGALRYEAWEEPLGAGYCYCRDCQRVSGSGFIPFLLFAASTIRFTGPTRQLVSTAARGGPATRNFCSLCGSLVFGGERDRSDSYTVYAGSLDELGAFQPRMAIFASNKPPWAPLPEGITKVFARLPEDEPGGAGS